MVLDHHRVLATTGQRQRCDFVEGQSPSADTRWNTYRNSCDETRPIESRGWGTTLVPGCYLFLGESTIAKARNAEKPGGGRGRAFGAESKSRAAVKCWA